RSDHGDHHDIFTSERFRNGTEDQHADSQSQCCNRHGQARQCCTDSENFREYRHERLCGVKNSKCIESCGEKSECRFSELLCPLFYVFHFTRLQNFIRFINNSLWYYISNLSCRIKRIFHSSSDHLLLYSHLFTRIFKSHLHISVRGENSAVL